MRYHYQLLDHGLSELPIALARRAMVSESGTAHQSLRMSFWAASSASGSDA
jgi:hypothetical protein